MTIQDLTVSVYRGAKVFSIEEAEKVAQILRDSDENLSASLSNDDGRLSAASAVVHVFSKDSGKFLGAVSINSGSIFSR